MIHSLGRRAVLGAMGAALLAALLLLLLYQVPVRQRVDIGGADGGYVGGFHEPELADVPAAAERPYLQGSASARWTRGVSYLLFPQAGLPAKLTLRWRAWRPDSAEAAQVRVVLLGAGELGTFPVGSEWSEATVAIDAGLLKPSDVAIVLESTTARLDDGREVGVLLDAATYTVGPAPITPYPFQLLYGSVAGGLLYLLLALRRAARPGWRSVALGLSLLAVLFLVLFRLQPPLIPYPLRWLLLSVDAALAALVVLALAPWLCQRPALLEGLLVGGGLLLWASWAWVNSSQHLVLSVPGVEKDFSVFAHRSETWGAVLRADGFYNLGYPFLLRLVRPFVHDSPFLAARLIALGAALVALLATWRLGRARWGRAVGLLALLALALSPLFIQYALYLGTDMPFAAATLLSLWPLLRRRVPAPGDAALAGLGGGLSFMVRHPGLLLLPVGLIYLLVVGGGKGGLQARLRAARRPLAALVAAFLVASSPQLIINLADTGTPLYNQQAKNVWLAVYGNTEWDNWDEERNDIGLGELIARDPARFFNNWWGNLQAFSGTGGARTEEFERAVQLRLLAWPLNLLALAGLAAWLLRREPAGLVLLAWSGLYLAAVALGFLLPRFALPLSPIYALGAGYALARIAARVGASRAHQRQRALAAIVMLSALLVYGQARTGAAAILAAQLPHEWAIARAVAALPNDQVVLAQLEPRTFLAKYSAVAHRLRPWPPDAEAAGADGRPGGALVVWEGPPPPGWSGSPLVSAGPLTLYRLP